MGPLFCKPLHCKFNVVTNLFSAGPGRLLIDKSASPDTTLTTASSSSKLLMPTTDYASSYRGSLSPQSSKAGSCSPMSDNDLFSESSPACHQPSRDSSPPLVPISPHGALPSCSSPSLSENSRMSSREGSPLPPLNEIYPSDGNSSIDEYSSSDEDPKEPTDNIASQTEESFCSDQDIINFLRTPQFFGPLYPGAEITTCGAIFAIMQFCQANKLSYTAIGGLLKLLDLLCPSQHQLPKSFHNFKKFFQQFQPAEEHVRVCLQCMERTCTCSSSSDHADLVNLDIRKPLRSIVSSKLLKLCIHNYILLPMYYY